MKDLIFKPNSNDTITITVAEQQAIIDANEEEDVVGIEQDLKTLFKSKYSGTVTVQFHIRYMTPSPAITFMYTADKDWWVK